MAQFLSEQGVAYLDLLPTFRERADVQLFGEIDKHLTEEGHRVVADEVYAFMSRAFDVR
jgi:hypothetical protein